VYIAQRPIRPNTILLTLYPRYQLLIEDFADLTDIAVYSYCKVCLKVRKYSIVSVVVVVR